MYWCERCIEDKHTYVHRHAHTDGDGHEDGEAIEKKKERMKMYTNNVNVQSGSVVCVLVFFRYCFWHLHTVFRKWRCDSMSSHVCYIHRHFAITCVLSTFLSEMVERQRLNVCMYVWMEVCMVYFFETEIILQKHQSYLYDRRMKWRMKCEYSLIYTVHHSLFSEKSSTDQIYFHSPNGFLHVNKSWEYIKKIFSSCALVDDKSVNFFLSFFFFWISFWVR